MSAIRAERLGAKRLDRRKVSANSGATRILSTASPDHAEGIEPARNAVRAATNSIQAATLVSARARATAESTSQNERHGRRKKSAAAVAGTAATPNTARKRRLSPKSYMAPYVCRSAPFVAATKMATIAEAIRNATSYPPRTEAILIRRVMASRL